MSAAIALRLGVAVAAPASGVPAGAVPPSERSELAAPACADPCPDAALGCCDRDAVVSRPAAERVEVAAAMLRAATDAEAAERAWELYGQTAYALLVRLRWDGDDDALEARAREVVAELAAPAVAYIDPTRVSAWRRRVDLMVAEHLVRASRRLRIDRRSAAAAIRGRLDRAALLLRALAWDDTRRVRHWLEVELHEALLLAIDSHQTWRVCPAILELEAPSERLEIDARVCRNDPRDRAALREVFVEVGALFPRDVDLWRRHVRLRDPLQIAAITTSALAVGAAASALLLDQRYLALCRHTSADARACVFDESPQAAAARRASVSFAIAAPALLVTSLALFAQRWRERRARRSGLCGLPTFGAAPRSAAVTFSCRF
ncbi:MAG: hypothetical protein R3A79_10870 [Nannocystaceae bacterium]